MNGGWKGAGCQYGFGGVRGGLASKELWRAYGGGMGDRLRSVGEELLLVGMGIGIITGLDVAVPALDLMLGVRDRAWELEILSSIRNLELLRGDAESPDENGDTGLSGDWRRSLACGNVRELRGLGMSSGSGNWVCDTLGDANGVVVRDFCRIKGGGRA